LFFTPAHVLLAYA